MGDDTPMPVLSHTGALAVRLLPPAVRAGDQPADRSAARVDRDVAADRRSGRSATSSSRRPSTRARWCWARRSCRSASCARSSRCRGGHARVHRPAVRPRRRACRLRSARMCAQAESAVRDGKLVLLLSDRYLVQGQASRCTRCWPPARSTSTWCSTGLRCKCNLLIETGTARDPHHFACLIGYGATAVYPYMAYQVLFEMMRKGRVKLDFADAPRARAQLPRGHPQGPVQDHVEDGHLHHRQLSQLAAVRDRRACTTRWWTLCFTGTESRIQGADFADLRGRPASSSPRAPGIRASRSSRAACSSTCTAASTTCTTRT